MTERVADWPEKLQALINEHRDAPFEWGSHDCALWAGKAIVTLTGWDVSADWRGQYSTLSGAFKLLLKRGYRGPDEALSAQLGEPVPISMAGQGDIVGCDLAEHDLAGDDRQMGLSLGVCNGPLSYFVAEIGLIALPTISLDCCWKV